MDEGSSEKSSIIGFIRGFLRRGHTQAVPETEYRGIRTRKQANKLAKTAAKVGVAAVMATGAGTPVAVQEGIESGKQMAAAVGQTFERAITSPESGIEIGREYGRRYKASQPTPTPTREHPPMFKPTPAVELTPPLWQRTAVPAGQEPTPSPKIDLSKIKGT